MTDHFTMKQKHSHVNVIVWPIWKKHILPQTRDESSKMAILCGYELDKVSSDVERLAHRFIRSIQGHVPGLIATSPAGEAQS